MKALFNSCPLGFLKLVTTAYSIALYHTLYCTLSLLSLIEHCPFMDYFFFIISFLLESHSISVFFNSAQRKLWVILCSPSTFTWMSICISSSTIYNRLVPPLPVTVLSGNPPQRHVRIPQGQPDPSFWMESNLQTPQLPKIIVR